jgi:hypothetical protein
VAVTDADLGRQMPWLARYWHGDLAINPDYMVESDTCLTWWPFRTPATPHR